MEKHFVVYGKPVGKGRPRFNTRTGNAYTPDKTRKEEAKIKAAFKEQCGFGIFFTTSYLKVIIEAFYPIPKGDSKATKEQKVIGMLKPSVKPDIDNIIKLYLDALNHFAWDDDKQVVEVHGLKAYYDGPGKVEVTIIEV